MFQIVKLLATLSLDTKPLFWFLQHWAKGPVRPYSQKEKMFIKMLVRITSFPTHRVPSLKVRKLL